MNFVFYSIQYTYLFLFEYHSCSFLTTVREFYLSQFLGHFTIIPACSVFFLSCSCLLSLLFMSHCILPVISIIFMHYVYICHHSVWSAVTLDNTVLSLTCQSFLGSSFKCLLWLSGWHLYFFLFQTECGISEKHIQY